MTTASTWLHLSVRLDQPSGARSIPQTRIEIAPPEIQYRSRVMGNLRTSPSTTASSHVRPASHPRLLLRIPPALVRHPYHLPAGLNMRTLTGHVFRRQRSPIDPGNVTPLSARRRPAILTKCALAVTQIPGPVRIDHDHQEGHLPPADFKNRQLMSSDPEAHPTGRRARSVWPASEPPFASIPFAGPSRPRPRATQAGHSPHRIPAGSLRAPPGCHRRA